MYYHSRPLKYVEHGKVLPSPVPDPDLLPAYRWLGRYCGYCPQIWLSRGKIDITGVRGPKGSTLTKGRPRSRSDQILFGFDIIRGFPVDYENWHWVLQVALNHPEATPEEMDRLLTTTLEDRLAYVRRDDPDRFGPADYLLESTWDSTRSLKSVLTSCLFVERDQVVVPSLNLKSAKVIVCRNERQVKSLRKMGFIEDRIEIRNMPG